MIFKILTITALIAIAVSLASALIAMVRGGGKNEKQMFDKMFKAFVWRIGLSVFLFALLLIGYMTRIIEPLNY